MKLQYDLLAILPDPVTSLCLVERLKCDLYATLSGGGVPILRLPCDYPATAYDHETLMRSHCDRVPGRDTYTPVTLIRTRSED